MNGKAGLRALVIGAALLGGITSAKAITFSKSIYTNSDVSFEFDIPLDNKLANQASGIASSSINSIFIPGGSSYNYNIVASTSIQDKDGPIDSVYSERCGFTNLPVTCLGRDVGTFFTVSPEISSLKLVIDIMVDSFYLTSGVFVLGPPIAFTYNINVSLPDGVVVTPLPGALPLFASVLGVGGWLGYRRKRAQREAVAAAA